MFELKQQSCSLTEYVSCPPQAWGKGDVGMPWSTAYLLGANLDPYQFELRNAAWPRYKAVFVAVQSIMNKE
jgi:hypothetical protein